MASDCEMNVEPEPAEFLYSDVVKSRLLHVFQQMTNKITPTDFNDIFKEIEESDGVVRNVDEIAQTFKETLYQSICVNFKEMWHNQDMDLNLNMLRFCIDKCKNNTISWRPTGKTAEEQTKHIRIHYLKKKIAFIENAANVLSEHLKENVLPEVDANRAEIANLIERRNLMSQQIDIRMAQIGKSAENRSDLCQ